MLLDPGEELPVTPMAILCVAAITTVITSCGLPCTVNVRLF